MRRREAALLLSVIVLVAGARECGAAGGSRFSLRADFSANSYPSDESITSEWYPAFESDPPSCGADAQMTYHFDRKFGLSGGGALCWRVRPNLEIELGAAYTDMQLEITQHAIARGTGSCWGTPGTIGFYDYDTRKDADVSYVNARPAVNLTLSRKSRVIPYLSVGLDIVKITASVDVDFLLLTLNHEGSDYYTTDTTGAVRLDGSDWTFGLDIGSGLEVKLTNALSATVGFAYMFGFGKAFPEFEDLVAAGSEPAARSAQFHKDGMTLKHISAVIGFKMCL